MLYCILLLVVLFMAALVADKSNLVKHADSLRTSHQDSANHWHAEVVRTQNKYGDLRKVHVSCQNERDTWRLNSQTNLKGWIKSRREAADAKAAGITYLKHLKMAMWNLKENRERIERLRFALGVVAHYELDPLANRKAAIEELQQCAKRAYSTL